MATTHEFSDAEDLRTAVSNLIKAEKDVRFAHLQSNQLVLRRRSGEKPVKWLARIKLRPKDYADMFPEGTEYILEVDKDQFDSLDERQQEAVLFHELCHTHRNEKGKYKLLNHDLQEFNAVLGKYGPYLPDARRTIQT